MRHARDIAGWFIRNGYNPTNNRDGNLKLNKILYFAQLISLIKRDKALFEEELYAFKNGVVVESIRTEYSKGYHNFINLVQKTECNFTSSELDILELTKSIFLDVSPEELSDLTHEHKSWSIHYKKSKDEAYGGYDYNKESAKINIEDYFGKFKCDLDLVREIIEAKECKEDVSEEVISINGVQYYYNPKEVTINNYILKKLKEFPATEDAYTFYIDESQGLIIF
ncbi:Panacea domain-containing protein [Clostridium baratii]